MDAVTDCIPMNEGIVARIFLHTLFDFWSSVSQIIAERIQQMAASPNFAFKKIKSVIKISFGKLLTLDNDSPSTIL